MQTFQNFYFKSYDFDREKLIASFHYSFDDIENFTETIDFSSDDFSVKQDISHDFIDELLFHTSIALGISYYKLFPTKNLIVESGYLSETQINFWKKFYKNGLWEFLYQNKIDPNDLFDFQNVSEKSDKKDFSDIEVSEKALIPLGGWKDSMVSIEAFRGAWIDFETVVFGKMDAIKESVSKQIGRKNLLIKRKLSENLFIMNDAGYYNGHVPITWIIAFSLMIAGYIYGYKYIVLSNEKSADSPNTIWNGFEINHQYSKSLEFENDFRSYMSDAIWDKIQYFSLLRWMYEIKIAELFSELWKGYFTTFSSCNNNFKIQSNAGNKNTIWCNSCPKCMFVYAILSAFLSVEDLVSIFWKDLYEDTSLETTFSELLGLEWIKPFECVGEIEEVMIAMNLAIKKYKPDNIPYILQIFKKEILSRISLQEIKKLEKKLFKIERDDNIPVELKNILEQFHG